MKWFKHESNSYTQAKLKKLIMKHGAAGYAVYFHCIELIAGNISNDNITFELEHDSEIIADNLKILGTDKNTPSEVVSMIILYAVELGLFEESNSIIFCMSLAKQIDSSLIKNPKLKEIQLEIRENQRLSEKSTARLDQIRLEDK